MNKALWLKILNPILGVLIVVQVATGLLSDELPQKLFEAVHSTCGILLGFCVVLHVYLNWTWVKSNFFPKKK